MDENVETAESDDIMYRSQNNNNNKKNNSFTSFFVCMRKNRANNVKNGAHK